eukprot:TRINITY_DN726_c0_g1_i1.p1 TRINITY_DN726_c0_g1~~TRINITY_DN726_c0_g1_i1.p1  ORF type:complete len:294 (+),score=67.02 TRINITY_DN726_c0_g1_i1:366-1247(+)
MAPPIDGRVRWGDDLDDDGDDGLDGVLPPIQVLGPDENGYKIIIEYRYNERDEKVKVTTKSRVKKQVKKMNKNVIKRRQWRKFGEAALVSGNQNVTIVSTEEIFLERVKGPSGGKEAEKNELAGLVASGNTSLIVCRTCGKKGDHWTSKCPYKDLAKDGMFQDKAPTEDGPPGAAGAGAAPGRGAYVPPSMRAGANKEGEGMRQRGRDDNSIRVTNLSEDTREADLMELFRPFGPISRIYVAFDRETGLSRGFAFINFVNRDDAIRAISKINGYGYDNLILKVEWATPREEKR